MNNKAAADVVIFGGGIAGLWLLHRVRAAGLSGILFESGTLGGGQTHKSQGIIHGGMKYALQGTLTKDAQVLSDMPKLWRDCLAGKGEINLSAVPILSEHQYLFSPYKFTSKLAGFFAGATLTSKVSSLSRQAYPRIFQHPMFKGEVFALDEMVIDVPHLIRELVRVNQDAVYKIEPFSEAGFKFDNHGQLVSTTVYMAGNPIEVTAQQFIFTAGAGNEVITQHIDHIRMQRRPLHMVLVKLPAAYHLYAHCLGLGTRPRITITTHHMQDGSTIWYLGGLLAEEGVQRDSYKQIQATKQELANLFPWLNFAGAQYATFMIDRAEPKQKNGLKPTDAYFKHVANMIVAWPTKLALAPKLAQDIMLELANLKPQLADMRALRAWPMPPIAAPLWEDVFCKDVA